VETATVSLSYKPQPLVPIVRYSDGSEPADLYSW
jgi:hypothetical protein